MLEPIALNPENIAKANWQQVGQSTLPVLSVKQIRALEEAAFSQVDSFLLMQAAGIRSALKIRDHLLSMIRDHSVNQRYLVLAGPGNNGGDAFIVAGELKRQGFEVDLFQVATGDRVSNDRIQAVQWASTFGLAPIEFVAGMKLPEMTHNTVVIDGLLGIACNRAPDGLIEQLILQVNQCVNMPVDSSSDSIQVISLDCPSGLNCDTGMAPGAVIQAHKTLSYLACKHGLLTNHGKTLAGELWVDALSCEPLLNNFQDQTELSPIVHAISTQQQLRRKPKRGHEHHKGSFGSIAVLGGQLGMTGACILSARTALMLGCGRVALSLLSETDMHLPDVQRQGQSPFFDVLFPEVMNKGLEGNLEFADTAVVGPGLGQSDEAVQMIFALLEHDKGLNMVWDADALNLLATNSKLRDRFKHYRNKHSKKAMVLTPHPLEAARLLQSTAEMVQTDRVGAVTSLCEKFECTVVLKGAGSLIGQAKRIEINTNGGPALGTAGSGDVLAGAVAAMLGQGLDEFTAASFAVYLHGLAIEPLPLEALGRESLAGNGDGLLISHASEIARRMKAHLNHLLNQSARRNG